MDDLDSDEPSLKKQIKLETNSEESISSEVKIKQEIVEDDCSLDCGSPGHIKEEEEIDIDEIPSCSVVKVELSEDIPADTDLNQIGMIIRQEKILETTTCEIYIKQEVREELSEQDNPIKEEEELDDDYITVIKSHRCSYCSYKTVEAGNLKRHIKARHTGTKPHQCPHCSHKTVGAGDLKRHIMARHTDAKPRQCSFCSYKTVEASNLNRHIMARHTDIKPRQCSYCSYKTVEAGNLKKHIMAHHNDLPHKA